MLSHERYTLSVFKTNENYFPIPRKLFAVFGICIANFVESVELVGFDPSRSLSHAPQPRPLPPNATP